MTTPIPNTTPAASSSTPAPRQGPYTRLRAFRDQQAREEALRTAALAAGVPEANLPAPMTPDEQLALEISLVDDVVSNADTIPTPPPATLALFTPDRREAIKIPAPSKYGGRRDADKIRAWLYEFNNYATFHALNDAQKLAMVPYYLEGAASTWWISARNLLNPPRSWQEAEERLKKEFQPANHIKNLNAQILTIRQTTSVAAYSQAFHSILVNLPDFPESLALQIYIAGLKPDTRTAVDMQNPADIAEAEQLANRFDEIRFNTKTHLDTKKPTPRPQNYPTPRYNTASNQPNRLNKLTDAERQRLRSIGACFKCRQTGHLAINCPLRQNDQPQQPRPQNNNHQPARQRLQANAIATQTPAQLPNPAPAPQENGQRQ
jgi:Ty3 transposon capsid-like protein/Zinc knuckle